MKPSLYRDASKIYTYELEVPFSLGEYRERLDRVRRAMDRANVDVLYCSAPESMFYLTGYQMVWYSRDTLNGIVVHKDRDHVVHFECSDEELLARQTSIATDYFIYKYGSHEDPAAAIWKEGGTKGEGSKAVPAPRGSGAMSIAMTRVRAQRAIITIWMPTPPPAPITATVSPAATRARRKTL